MNVLQADMFGAPVAQHGSGEAAVALPAKLGGTALSYRPAREILTRATGFMGDYDFTLNPYSGCSFGCSYCYAAFFSRDVQLRDSWGAWVSCKENAVQLMQRRKPGNLDGKRIYMSSVTDPYQPIERKLELTRGLLEVMAARHSPKLVVQTRSPLVARDDDLFRRLQENGGRVQCNITITTDDEDVRRAFEPLCPSNKARLQAVQQLQSSGVDTCITMTPLLLVGEPLAFADQLVNTGVQKFIVQPFHFGKGKFVANTRERAYETMCKKLGCGRDAFLHEYMKRYQSTYEVLREKLPTLGEGKTGFAPPF